MVTEVGFEPTPPKRLVVGNRKRLEKRESKLGSPELQKPEDHYGIVNAGQKRTKSVPPGGWNDARAKGGAAEVKQRDNSIIAVSCGTERRDNESS